MLTVLLIVAIVYGSAVTFLLFKNPLPIPDRGFRIFATQAWMLRRP